MAYRAAGQLDPFTHICMICGQEVPSLEREPLPHTCRREQDAGL